MRKTLRVSRRQFLAMLVSLPVAFSLAGGVRDRQARVARAQGNGVQVKAAHLSLTPEDLVAGGAEGIRVSSGRLFAPRHMRGAATSRPIAAPHLFRAVGVRWTGDDEVLLALRTSPDGTVWTPWQELGRETGKSLVDAEVHSSTLFFVPNDERHAYVQCRVVSPGGDEMGSLTVGDFLLIFLDVTGEPPSQAPPEEAPAEQPLANGYLPALTMATVGIEKPQVVSRTAWGCPDGQASPGWPPEYFPVTHFVLHHTVTTNDATDWAAQVRLVWYWHAQEVPNGYGWGDIGYNYLIDPNGVIYEGRAGGDDVIAAHTYTFNSGTMGIAFLGTYINVTPTQAALNAAERLMAWKCGQKGYNPLDVADLWHPCEAGYVRKERIVGHRDFAGLVCAGLEDKNKTDCPGSALYALLPSIRTATANLNPTFRAEITSVSIGPELVEVGTNLRITVTVRNTGGYTLPNGSPGPSYVYSEGQVASYGAPNTFRIAVDYEGHDPAQGPYPYRWGLGGDLAPGESRTLTLNIKLNSEAGPRKYWVGLIREQVGMVVDHVGETVVYARVKRFTEAGIVNVRIAPSLVFTGGYLEVSAEVENWTGSPLPTQSPAPGYVYQEGEVCPPDVAGAFRLGVDYQGRTGKDHPYRWGVGNVPGYSVRTIRGYVRLMGEVSQRSFWAGFVKEQVAWLQDNLATSYVRVQRPRTRLLLPSVFE